MPARGVDPCYPDAIADAEAIGASAGRGNPSDDLVAQDDRKPRGRGPAFDLIQLRVANATGPGVGDGSGALTRRSGSRFCSISDIPSKTIAFMGIRPPYPDEE
jgi:hypothetical protein